MSDLPESWCKVELRNLIELNPKNQVSDEVLVGFVPMNLIGCNYLSKVDFDTRMWSEVKKGYTHFANEDVLLAKITPCFENGKAGIVTGLPNGVGAGSTEYFVCRCKRELLNSRYLLALFKSSKFLKTAERSMTGTVGHKRVPKEFLLGTEIALAPINEQKRIADKLDVLLGRVDSCRERLELVPLLLKRFRQSVLAAATSGKLTEDWRDELNTPLNAKHLAESLKFAHQAAGGHKKGNAAGPTDGVHDLNESQFPPGWKILELRELVCPDRPITYGILMPGPELIDGVPYIRVADYPNNCLNVKSVRKTSPLIDKEFSRSRLREGDLLLSIRGTVGRIIEIPPILSGANITQDSARLSIQPIADRTYVKWFLESETAQSRMKRATKGVAVRGINIGDVRALQIALPPIKEQNEIVRRVEKLFEIVNRLEQKIAAARIESDRLTPAILTKAFQGELVPQDPNDEPAANLLARISLNCLDKKNKKEVLVNQCSRR